VGTRRSRVLNGCAIALLYLGYHRFINCLQTYTKSILEAIIIMIATATHTMTTSKARLTILIDAEIKEDFEKLCELENRSMSNFAETLLKNFVDNAKREGKLKK
jgi:hypothetical protein